MIEIDACHRSLIAAVIRCSKPWKILELGYGTGSTTNAILQAIELNERGELTVVDNFFDWDGVKPPHLVPRNFELVVASEDAYVAAATPESWDVIVADADHFGTDRRIFKIVEMLRPGGFLFAHDICNPLFPNLLTIPKSLHGTTFEGCSAPGEECHRGLFMYRKP